MITSRWNSSLRAPRLLGSANANSRCSANSRFPKNCFPAPSPSAIPAAESPPYTVPKAKGHAAWSLTFMAAGKKRVERIPKDWVDDVRRRVAAGRAFQDALREVLTANAELLVLRRRQQPR